MRHITKLLLILSAALVIWTCNRDEFWEDSPAADQGVTLLAEGAGNNLSFPVIWAEPDAIKGQLAIPTPPGGEEDVVLEGAWWYVWGPDADGNPLSCEPDPDNLSVCKDGSTPGPNAHRAYLQKDFGNVWQATTIDANAEVIVDTIDWGDNLESVNWYTRSQVRTEVVLYKDNETNTSWRGYDMLHVSGWGIDEVHGLAADDTPAPVDIDKTLYHPQATVYTPNARLTIQKLLVQREEVGDLTLEWDVDEGKWLGAGINEPIFNKAVHEGEDGPGFYSAETNVKGKIIFGYTWNVRKLNDMTLVPPYDVPTPAGDYRITFSFDELNDNNTKFVEGTTSIKEATEEVEAVADILAADDGSGGGGVPVIDFPNNLTYIDVRILEREGGGNGGGGNGGGGKGGGNGAGGNGNGGGGNGNGGGKGKPGGG